eukprot:GDKI01031049.1.p2 GENE.GDKI01031049.1~~GDKI01031049.1.p2  ORF type:complete len:162 (-),score=65.82 GDKI01031049.1:132-617(-)
MGRTSKMSLCELAAPRSIQTVKDVSAEAFIASYAKHLKKSGKMTIPKWVEYAKTGVSREMCPLESDWLYVRTASLARRIYIRPGVGVGGFKKCYGQKKGHGVTPGHFSTASGKVIRFCLQQLEKMGLVEVDAKGGRRITKEGQRELDTIAVQAGATYVNYK